MARSHELPNWFAHVDVGSGTPKRASALVTAVAAAVAIGTNVFEVISSATLFLLVLYTLGSASLCISQSKGEVGRFNVPVLVPYAAVFTNASFLVYYLMFEFDTIKFVMGVISASTLWFFANHSRSARDIARRVQRTCSVDALYFIELGSMTSKAGAEDLQR